MTIADSGASDSSRYLHIKAAVERVNAQIQEACQRAQRAPSEVCLLAVSKTKPVSDIEHAYRAGQRHFGENYVQEGVEKITTLAHLPEVTWHFIGPLQSNKTKEVASHFDWMHSIDRLKIARRLDEQRPVGLPPLQVLIQINIDDEASKAGIRLDALTEFAAQLSAFEHLTLRGVMAIPKAYASEAEQCASFSRLASAFHQLQGSYPSVDTLSLGMSGDLEPAIAHGSTMVRIGTAIFGQRKG